MLVTSICSFFHSIFYLSKSYSIILNVVVVVLDVDDDDDDDELFTTQFQLLTTLRKKPFENIVGKGENVGNQQFVACK